MTTVTVPDAVGVTFTRKTTPMTTVNVSWTTKQQAQGAVAPGVWQVLLQNASAQNVTSPQAPASGATSVTFSNVNLSPGDYVVLVRRYDVQGAVLAQSQAGFTISAPVVMVDAPDVVNVTLS